MPRRRPPQLKKTRARYFGPIRSIFHPAVKSKFYQSLKFNFFQGGPVPVGALESHGIGAADVKKLREAGYHTVESIVYGK